MARAAAAYAVEVPERLRRLGVESYPPVRERVVKGVRWSPDVWDRICALALELGLKKNAVLHVLVTEALDARDRERCSTPAVN